MRKNCSCNMGSFIQIISDLSQTQEERMQQTAFELHLQRWFFLALQKTALLNT